jgi:hypothetical protein
MDLEILGVIYYQEIEEENENGETIIEERIRTDNILVTVSIKKI